MTRHDLFNIACYGVIGFTITLAITVASQQLRTYMAFHQACQAQHGRVAQLAGNGRICVRAGRRIQP